ncbi:DUF4238 domain-containing protein [Pseudomonas sp. 1928-m]|uniref:DUF4238 domain-containing protein n=1 Tax=Pseudomonas sp. 1928-m TaxID=3033804 RepID=UPI0023DEE55C|nr:DUF4238 domain-containing protein [Pseudomonas sp. 1928-m]MDF3197001.1 DUF4238 domain-containing protein [Pseudomonas sp. 1928-m]
MATNKNQHFVPRCHLRPFTLNSKNAAINAFNIDRQYLIRNAPVKNQCSRDYFYGKDEKLEKAIQFVESSYANALSQVIANHKTFNEGSKAVFRIFWLLQHMRTEATAIQAVAMSESTRVIADIPPEEFSLGIKDAVQIAMKSFYESMHEIDDLKFCLIRNKTNLPFITSDNPAILTNKWHLTSHRSPGRSFGLGSAGALTFLPLTPDLLFVGYDGDVYNIPNNKGITEARNERDVIAFNQHQFLQCISNTYIHDSSYEALLVNHYLESQPARPKDRHITHYAEYDKTVGNHKRYAVVPAESRDKTKEAFIHIQVIHPTPTLWPSHIHIRSKGSVYSNGTGLGYVRYSRALRTSGKNFLRERP